jgi:hypothetical protein
MSTGVRKVKILRVGEREDFDHMNFVWPLAPVEAYLRRTGPDHEIPCTLVAIESDSVPPDQIVMVVRHMHIEDGWLVGHAFDVESPLSHIVDTLGPIKRVWPQSRAVHCQYYRKIELFALYRVYLRREGELYAAVS